VGDERSAIDALVDISPGHKAISGEHRISLLRESAVTGSVAIPNLTNHRYVSLWYDPQNDPAIDRAAPGGLPPSRLSQTSVHRYQQNEIVAVREEKDPQGLANIHKPVKKKGQEVFGTLESAARDAEAAAKGNL
jgi:hypothetical protein